MAQLGPLRPAWLDDDLQMRFCIPWHPTSVCSDLCRMYTQCPAWRALGNLSLRCFHSELLGVTVYEAVYAPEIAGCVHRFRGPGTVSQSCRGSFRGSVGSALDYRSIGRGFDSRPGRLIWGLFHSSSFIVLGGSLAQFSHICAQKRPKKLKTSKHHNHIVTEDKCITQFTAQILIRPTPSRNKLHVISQFTIITP